MLCIILIIIYEAVLKYECDESESALNPLIIITTTDFRLHRTQSDKTMMSTGAAAAAFKVGIIPTNTKTSSSSSSRNKEQHHPNTIVKRGGRMHRRHHQHLLRATKKGQQKTEDNNKSSSSKSNFIKYQSKPYTDKDGNNPRPWYIDEATGKANGLVVIFVFLASQVFIGTVLQPLAVFINQLWEPIVGGNLYLDNIY